MLHVRFGIFEKVCTYIKMVGLMLGVGWGQSQLVSIVAHLICGLSYGNSGLGRSRR